MTLVGKPICMTCRHLHRDENAEIFGCDAFPAGIPQAIVRSEHDHHQPYKGDHGIRYEPTPDTEARKAERGQ